MAKVIRYELCTKTNRGTHENPLWVEVLSTIDLGYSEFNELIAKQEAHNGEYTILDDGIEETGSPTIATRLAVIENIINKIKTAFPNLI